MLLLLPNLDMGGSPSDAPAAVVSTAFYMRNSRVMSYGRGAFAAFMVVLTCLS